MILHRLYAILPNIQKVTGSMLVHSTPMRAAQTAARPAARSALSVRAMASGSGSDGQVRSGPLLLVSVAAGVWPTVTHPPTSSHLAQLLQLIYVALLKQQSAYLWYQLNNMKSLRVIKDCKGVNGWGGVRFPRAPAHQLGMRRHFPHPLDKEATDRHIGCAVLCCVGNGCRRRQQ